MSSTATKLDPAPAADTPDAFEGIDPKTIREKAGLEPDAMARLLGMSPYGYRAWEAGTRRPGGPAFRLLKLIGDDPETLRRALAT